MRPSEINESAGCCGGDHVCGCRESGPGEVREAVREGYGRIARGEAALNDAGGCGCGPSEGGCCGPTTLSPEQVAMAIGYGSEDLSSVPDGANMGLSCGNPTAIASLRPGEILLDLGSGGGFDCFVAGPKVGAHGRVIGVDMTPDMVARARRGLPTYRERSGLNNVEFRLGEIEHLPVEDESVDVVISNCVLNLSPDKRQVWREIARVLKPGGRVAISDLALLKPLPENLIEGLGLLIGCISGASLLETIREDAEASGLADVTLLTKSGYVDAMVDWQDPLYREIIAKLPSGDRPSDYITSVEITGKRPGSGESRRCCM